MIILTWSWTQVAHNTLYLIPWGRGREVNLFKRWKERLKELTCTGLASKGGKENSSTAIQSLDWVHLYRYHQLKLRPFRNRIIVYPLSLFFFLFLQRGILH